MRDSAERDETARQPKLDSEGARRLIALFAIVAAVGAQGVVTRDVVANQNVQGNDFGTRLLAAELAVPAPPRLSEPLVLMRPATGLSSSAATFFAPKPEPIELDPVTKRWQRWVLVPAFDPHHEDTSWALRCNSLC